jgi:hypothetical protein
VQVLGYVFPWRWESSIVVVGGPPRLRAAGEIGQVKGRSPRAFCYVEREVRFGRYLVVFPTDKLTACRAKDFRRPRVCLEPTSKLHFWMFALPALLEASD